MIYMYLKQKGYFKGEFILSAPEVSAAIGDIITLKVSGPSRKGTYEGGKCWLQPVRITSTPVHIDAEIVCRVPPVRSKWRTIFTAPEVELISNKIKTSRGWSYFRAVRYFPRKEMNRGRRRPA